MNHSYFDVIFFFNISCTLKHINETFAKLLTELKLSH